MCNLCLAKSFTSVPQQFPRRDVFCASNPHVKVGVNPRCGEDAVVLRNFFRGGNCFANGHRGEIGIALNLSVKFPQKITAVARVILPSIFTVKEQTDCQRSIARNTFAQKTKPSVQIGGSGLRIHAAIDERNEVREMVVAEKPGDALHTDRELPRPIESFRIRRQSTCLPKKTDIQRSP